MSVRRWVGAGVALGVGLTLGLQPVQARAAIGSAALEIGAFVEVSQSWCEKPDWREDTPTTSTNTATTAISAGQTRELEGNLSGQAGGSKLSASRFVRGSYSANSWGTRRVVLRGSVAVSAGPNPSPCTVKKFNATVRVYTLGMSAPKRSWLVVRSSGARSGSGGVIVGMTGRVFGSQPPVLQQPDGAITRLVPAGEYEIGAELKPQVSVPAGSTTTRRASASVSAKVSLFPIGTVRSHGGTGTRFVAFKHRSCAYDRVPVQLGRSTPTLVKSITFYVNGDRRFTLSGRELRRTTAYLRAIPKKSAGSVRAAIVLKSGAKRSVSSTSWPCA